MHPKLSGCVLWDNVFSSAFLIKSGVRQGGINSPLFFNVYINDLIVWLHSSGFGCHLCTEYLGCIFFADDILVLSASIFHLQGMLDLCYTYGVEFDTKFNQAKSYLLQVGSSSHHSLPNLMLNNVASNWADRIKYLGKWIVAGKKFYVDMTINNRKFLGAVCGILQKCGHLSEEIKWNIIQYSCCPILFYCLNSINLNTEQVRKMSVAHNTAVRRCFNLKRYTSVRNILYYFNCIPINMLSERRVLLVS